MIKWLVFLGLFKVTFAYSQHGVSYRDSVINTEDFKENADALTNRLATVGNALDSFDLVLLGRPDMIGSIMVSLLVDEESTLTYGMIYDELVKVKDIMGEQYLETRQDLFALNALLVLVPTEENWESFKSLVIKAGATAHDIDQLAEAVFAQKNNGLTYAEILESLAMQAREEAENAKSSREEAIDMLLEELLEEEDALLELYDLARQSAESKAPIAVYFTGFGCVNCRRLENTVFRDHQLLETLLDDFIFQAVYVDNSTELPEGKRATAKLNGRSFLLETVGDFNTFQQLKHFKTAHQPYIVFMDAELNILDTVDYQDCHTTADFREVVEGVFDDFFKTLEK